MNANARARALSQIDAWAHGRSALIRLPLLIYFAWVFRNHLNNPFYNSLPGGLNLVIHELGHFLWAPLGQFWSILGGSLTQCLVPVVVAGLFVRQRDYFAVAVTFCWLSTNLFGVATYAADALTQQLPLVSPVGDDPIHDWGFLLTKWQKLSRAAQIGDWLRNAASASMLIGLGGGGWILWRMHKLRRPPTP
ncbi:MAG: hypothetical protein ACRENP_17170 [Longimicrobiales bacterium]